MPTATHGRRQVTAMSADHELMREIAVRLSLPPGTVKGRMRLGLKKLRDQLDVAD